MEYLDDTFLSLCAIFWNDQAKWELSVLISAVTFEMLDISDRGVATEAAWESRDSPPQVRPMSSLDHGGIQVLCRLPMVFVHFRRWFHSNATSLMQTVSTLIWECDEVWYLDLRFESVIWWMDSTTRAKRRVAFCRILFVSNMTPVLGGAWKDWHLQNLTPLPFICGTWQSPYNSLLP